MKNKSLNSILLILFSVVLILISLFLIFHNEIIIDVKELNVKYEIGEKTGFNIESENLNFGRLMPGNKGTRSIAIYNEYSFPINVQIISSPNLYNLLIFNESLQFISPNETLRMSLTLISDKQAKIGNYTGLLRLKIYRA